VEGYGEAQEHSGAALRQERRRALRAATMMTRTMARVMTTRRGAVMALVAAQ